MTPELTQRFWLIVGGLVVLAVIILAAHYFSRGGGSLTVRWGDRIESYTVHCGQAPGQYSVVQSVPASKQEVTFNHLAPGKWYCAVTATNKAGTSGYSKEVSKEVEP